MKIPNLLEFFAVVESDDGSNVIPFRRPKPADKLSTVERVPVSSIFKGKPKPVIKSDEYKKKQYSWGDLRTIEVGSSYTATINDKQWWRIKLLKSSQEFSFTDDAGQRWSIKKGTSSEDVPKNNDPVFLLKLDGRTVAYGNWKDMVRAFE